MSIETSFQFLNANDPSFISAAAAPVESKVREDWEDEHGSIHDRPGAPVGSYEEKEAAISYTEDEYGGWVIDLSKLPKGTTHVAVYRC